MYLSYFFSSHPKRKLGQKACKEIACDDDWKAHLRKYGHKVVDEKKKEKYILIDLGVIE